MDCETPVILAIVAVGAIARTFELRMPLFLYEPAGCPSPGVGPGSHQDIRCPESPEASSVNQWVECPDPTVTLVGFIAPLSSARMFDALIA